MEGLKHCGAMHARALFNNQPLMETLSFFAPVYEFDYSGFKLQSQTRQWKNRVCLFQRFPFLLLRSLGLSVEAVHSASEGRQLLQLSFPAMINMFDGSTNHVFFPLKKLNFPFLSKKISFCDYPLTEKVLHVHAQRFGLPKDERCELRTQDSFIGSLFPGCFSSFSFVDFSLLE